MKFKIFPKTNLFDDMLLIRAKNYFTIQFYRYKSLVFTRQTKIVFTGHVFVCIHNPSIKCFVNVLTYRIILKTVSPNVLIASLNPGNAPVKHLNSIGRYTTDVYFYHLAVYSVSGKNWGTIRATEKTDDTEQPFIRHNNRTCAVVKTVSSIVFIYIFVNWCFISFITRHKITCTKLTSNEIFPLAKVCILKFNVCSKNLLNA